MHLQLSVKRSSDDGVTRFSRWLIPALKASCLVLFQSARKSTVQLYRHEHELLRELSEVDSALDDYDRRAGVGSLLRLAPPLTFLSLFSVAHTLFRHTAACTLAGMVLPVSICSNASLPSFYLV